MRHQSVVHLERRNLFTATINYFLESAEDREIPVFVENAFVTRPEPSVGKCGSVSVRVPYVSTRHVGAANRDLAAYAGRGRLAVRIESHNLRASRYSDCSIFSYARRKRVAGNLMR